METTGAIQSMSHGMDGKLLVTLALAPKHLELITKLKNEELDVRFDKHRNKRSLPANGYAWQKIGEIAEKMYPPMSKQQVYELMLKRYGQGGWVILPKDDRLESMLRTFDYYEFKGDGETKGKPFVHYMVWVGSHHYNSKEFWVFICGIQDECRELGIEILTPNELRKMTEGWGK